MEKESYSCKDYDHWEMSKKKWEFVKLSTLLSRRTKEKNLKESEKKDKYLDLARELEKLWNIKVTIVPIVIGALGTITKGLLKGLEDLEVGGRVAWRLEETCCRSNSSKNHQLKLMWKTLKE